MGAPAPFGIVFARRESFTLLCTAASGGVAPVIVAGTTCGRGFTGVTVFMERTGCCRLKLGAMPIRLEGMFVISLSSSEMDKDNVAYRTASVETYLDAR